MRLPGVHVLLTAGVVALTTVGTVSAFSLTGAQTAAPPLPPAAPPPAAAAPVVPAPPLPVPPTGAASRPVAGTGEPTTGTTRPAPDEEGVAGTGAQDQEPDTRPERRAERREQRERPRPGRHHTNDRFDNQVEYACQQGYVDEEYCGER